MTVCFGSNADKPSLGYIDLCPLWVEKQTFAVKNGMSALQLKADMCGAKRDVRFVPIGDIARTAGLKGRGRQLEEASSCFLGANTNIDLSLR